MDLIPFKTIINIEKPNILINFHYTNIITSKIYLPKCYRCQSSIYILESIIKSINLSFYTILSKCYICKINKNAAYDIDYINRMFFSLVPCIKI